MTDPVLLSAPPVLLDPLGGAGVGAEVALPPDPGEPVPVDTDVAVVGTAGWFPGAEDPDMLWRNASAAADVMTDWSDDDLRALGVPAGLLDREDLVRAGGALPPAVLRYLDGLPDDVDPQHPVFAEVVRRALADAGLDPLPPELLVGLFGAAGPDRRLLAHQLRVAAAGDLSWDALLPTGSGADHMVFRTAHQLGLQGPALAVQATCAGSLAAVCTAATALVDLQCDVAVAGGVHLTEPRYLHRPQGTVSPDGRCRAFSADADGSGMSSGAGAVVLRRLVDARADGDRVLAVIRGYAIGNDGAARAGFAVPSAAGQQAVVAQAQAVAGVAPHEVSAVFCHALGTPVGDAIEVAALRRVREDDSASPDAPPTVLVAPKTHLGNLDVASGIAALVLAVQSLRERRLPGNLHLERIHPLLAPGPLLHPATGPLPLPERAVVGVSAFGVGGADVHVVLAAPGDPEPAR